MDEQWEYKGDREGSEKGAKSDIADVARRIAIWVFSLVLTAIGALSLLGALNGGDEVAGAILMLTSVAAFAIVLTNLRKG